MDKTDSLKVNHEVWQAKFGSTELYYVLRVTSCHVYTIYMYVYIGFFITANGVAAPTVHSTVHRYFKLNYNTGYTLV